MSTMLPVSPDELARLASVLHYEILDTRYEENLDELTSFAASIFQVPIVLITILDAKRQWFKSNYGLDVRETDRSISFCQFTIMKNDFFEIEDTWKDERFAKNPLVTEHPHIRYYCGTPLINEAGFAMGSLALIDTKPRKITASERKTLGLLAQQVLNFFELTMKKKELEKEKQFLEKRVKDRTADLELKVSELEQRDKKLISLNNELSRFIYKLSHDLLGPLKSIDGLINLSLEEAKEKNIIDYLQLQQKSARKLDNTLVSLIKLISIKEPCDISTINWNEVIEHSINDAKKRVPDSKVNLEIEISSEEKFRADRKMLEMMMEEFLVNSLQYNLQPIVDIKLNILDVKDHVLIQIIDNGIGIRKEEEENIFEMFYKNEKSRGSGLGLYIAKNIIEKMRGTVTVESPRNQGTKFQILLPLKIMPRE